MERPNENSYVNSNRAPEDQSEQSEEYIDEYTDEKSVKFSENEAENTLENNAWSNASSKTDENKHKFAQNPAAVGSELTTNETAQNADSAAKARRKRRKAALMKDTYAWSSMSEILTSLSRVPEQTVAAAQVRVNEELDRRGVTFADLLSLPATMLNQRSAAKVLRLEEKQRELVEEAVDAVTDLILLAQVHKIQLQAALLRDQYKDERARRRLSKLIRRKEQPATAQAVNSQK